MLPSCFIIRYKLAFNKCYVFTYDQGDIVWLLYLDLNLFFKLIVPGTQWTILITMYIYMVTSFRLKHFSYVLHFIICPLLCSQFVLSETQKTIWTLIGCLSPLFLYLNVLVSYFCVFMLLASSFWESSFYFYNLYWISISTIIF